MIKKASHLTFVLPDDQNVKIWRYMDFAKFVSLLERKGLFFSRVDRLGDPFEGSYAAGNEEERKRVYELLGIPTRFIKEKGAGGFIKGYRKYIMVNCWHMSKYESAAMWKLYSRTEEAICIQSTYKRLRDCIPDIHIGTVQYIDYEYDKIPEWNIFYPFMYKRKSFEHEQELRAVYLWRTTKPPKE